MGTKNNPGSFDCYHNAKPDEPMFILLGRDKHAPLLVELWALLRARDGEAEAKIEEALTCAESMRQFAIGLGKMPSYPEPKHLTEMQLAATTGMDAHPDDYDGACWCNACRSEP